jgi:hypothetical protein
MVVAVWFLNRAIGTWDSLPTLIVEVLAGILAYVAALRILAPELFGRALLVVTRRA